MTNNYDLWKKSSVFSPKTFWFQMISSGRSSGFGKFKVDRSVPDYLQSRYNCNNSSCWCWIECASGINYILKKFHNLRPGKGGRDLAHSASKMLGAPCRIPKKIQGAPCRRPKINPLPLVDTQSLRCIGSRCLKTHLNKEKSVFRHFLWKNVAKKILPPYRVR